MRQHQTLFANFILKFGEQDLADYLEEIVLPSFVEDTLYRRYGSSTFYLFDVKIFEFDEGRYCIAGHFIQDATLTRTHIFNNRDGLVEDVASMESAISSFFVLTLDDHKLIYHASTQHAPELSSFEATMSRFLSKMHWRYIDNAYRSGNDAEVRITKKSLVEQTPVPKLKVIPISSEDDIEEFVRRYAILKRMDIIVHKPNSDIDASESIAAIDFIRDRVGADRAKLTMSESEGLNPEGAIQTMQEAGKSGNHELRLSGLDGEGNKLDGSNDDFSVKAQIELPPLETEQMAGRLIDKMRELIAAGVLTWQEAGPYARQKVSRIMSILL